jgi:hypothetical protein
MSNRKIEHKSIIILKTCFILFQAAVYSQNTKNSTSPNQTNSNNSAINSDIISSAIMLTKTLMTITDKCKDNQMLSLLRNDFMNNILDTLNDEPEDSNQDYCKREGEKTCCTSNTYNVFLNEFNNIILPNRQKIFNKNMNLYTRIIDEHYRNFFNFYNFNDEQFNALFSDYKFYVKNITGIVESIVKESMLFKWNTLCNFVCYPHLNGLCKVYNVTYLYNDTLYYDLNYDCELSSNPRVIKIQNLIDSLNTELRSINNTVGMFYSYVNDNMEKISKLNKLTFNVTSNNETFSLLKNSLQDGLYVSKKITNKLQCGNSSNTNFIIYKNDYVPQNDLSINSTCENIFDNVCQPFECLDNFFLQFNDDSVANSQSYLIYSNITKVNLSTYKRSTDLFSFYDNDALSLVNSTIQFANSAIFLGQFRIIFYVIIYLFLI